MSLSQLPSAERDECHREIDASRIENHAALASAQVYLARDNEALSRSLVRLAASSRSSPGRSRLSVRSPF
jgi:hypothetical protein